MKFIACFCAFLSACNIYGKCSGRFVNPVTDICWSCLFPITIGGLRVSPNNEDTGNPRQLLCTCGTPVPRVGIPISFGSLHV